MRRWQPVMREVRVYPPRSAARPPPPAERERESRSASARRGAHARAAVYVVRGGGLGCASTHPWVRARARAGAFVRGSPVVTYPPATLGRPREPRRVIAEPRCARRRVSGGGGSTEPTWEHAPLSKEREREREREWRVAWGSPVVTTTSMPPFQTSSSGRTTSLAPRAAARDRCAPSSSLCSARTPSRSRTTSPTRPAATAAARATRRGSLVCVGCRRAVLCCAVLCCVCGPALQRARGVERWVLSRADFWRACRPHQVEEVRR